MYVSCFLHVSGSSLFVDTCNRVVVFLYNVTLSVWRSALSAAQSMINGKAGSSIGNFFTLTRPQTCLTELVGRVVLAQPRMVSRRSGEQTDSWTKAFGVKNEKAIRPYMRAAAPLTAKRNIGVNPMATDEKHTYLARRFYTVIRKAVSLRRGPFLALRVG